MLYICRVKIKRTPMIADYTIKHSYSGDRPKIIMVFNYHIFKDIDLLYIPYDWDIKQTRQNIGRWIIKYKEQTNGDKN